MNDPSPGCLSQFIAFGMMFFSTFLAEEYIISDGLHIMILIACVVWMLYGGNLTNSYENYSNNMDEIANNKKKLANNKKIKYHQNKIKKLDKVQRDLKANFADAQNDLAAAQATAQFTTDVSIRNQAEKAQRLIQNDIQIIQSTMADNEANLAKYNVDIGKYQADTEHRKKTDAEFKKSYKEAGEFIDSLGKYGEADYAKPILAFLKKNKGKKFFVKEIKAKLNATTPFTKKYKCLKFGISLTETKDACSYLWTRDKIEKTGNHKYYLED